MRAKLSSSQRDQRCILVIKSDSDGFLGLVLGRPVASSGCEEVEGCGSPAKQEVAPSSFSVQSDLSIASRGTNDPGYRVCNSSYLIGCAQIRLFKNNLVLDMHLRNVMRMSNVSKVSWIVMRKRISFLKHYNRPRYDKEDQQKGFRKFIRKNKISTYFSRYLCSLFKVWWLRVQDR